MEAGRLEQARSLLRRLEERAAQGTQGQERLLPVVEPLAALLPGGGLRRGATAAVARDPGGTSLLLALLAEASAEGAWVGVVGHPGLGLVAAAEAGIRLERLALVPRPGREFVAVASALLDGLDVVVLAGPALPAVRAADRARLAARARQRGAVLLAHGPWPGADLELSCERARWVGPQQGAGRLRARRVEVRASGRGCGPVGRCAWLLLPGLEGRVTDPGAGAAQESGGAADVTGVVSAVAG